MTNAICTRVGQLDEYICNQQQAEFITDCFFLVIVPLFMGFSFTKNILRWSGGTWLKNISKKVYNITGKNLRATALEDEVCLYQTL